MHALVVFIVFFGPLPPWLPLTLQSMAANRNVSFVLITDAPPPTLLPPNLHVERIAFSAMQAKLRAHLSRSHPLSAGPASVNYSFTYKANDIKPLAADLYPHLAAGHEWWAWADLDVIFGDLLFFLDAAIRSPACCKVPLRSWGVRKGEPKKLSAVNVYTHKVTRLLPRPSTPYPPLPLPPP